MVDILGIGASGLSAYRKLLETVGGNITNATTDGYVRRDVQMSVVGDSTMSPTAAATTSGSGVMVDTVRRASDSFLQLQALKSNSLNMQSQTLADSLSQLEKTLFATSSNPGSVVQDFYSRFNDVANAPTSAAARTSVVDSGKEVANMFVQTAASIQDSLDSARQGIDAALTAVNGITSQLGRLNVQIASASTSGQKPNDLLDQRDKLLTSLSNLANFNYTEQTNGAITVYLGDTASGRPIVTADGSHPLGAVDSGDKIEIVMDPFSAPSTTNQLTSGTVAGLLDFRSQTQSLLNDVNRLAVGFSNAVNQQHEQGVDLNGLQGGALFSTDGLTAAGAKTNLGDAKLTLSVDNAASLSAATYTVTYNGANNAWTVKSSDGSTVSGQNNLSLDGVTFAFDGAAHDQDTFTVSPLFGAASSMKFLLKNPDDVAVALPLYVDPASTNAGDGTLLPLKRTDSDPTPAIPSATDLYNSSNTVTDFRFNGAAFFLPAGTSAATLNSLGNFSAVHFTASGSDVAALTTPDSNGSSSLSLAITLDGAIQPPLSLNLKGSSLNDVADAINAAANQAGNGDAYFASVTNGALSINALGAHKVAKGALVGAGYDSSGAPIQISGVDESGAAAAQMQIFTREGRQLSGPALSDAQAAALLTTANGFLPDAKYVPPSNTTGYPGVNLTTADPLLKAVTSGQSTTIDVSTQSAFNTPQVGADGKASSGAVYAMDIAGLSSVRVAGDALSGATSADVASALTNQLNGQAGRYAWLGAPINFTDSMTPTTTFNVSVDGGEPRTITFNRSQDTRGLTLAVTGSKLGSQTITIDKASGSSNGVQWNYADGKLQISSADPSMKIDASTPEKAAMARALGFTGAETVSNNLAPQIGASQTSSLLRETGTFDLGGATDLQVSLVSTPPTLTVKGAAIGTQTITLDQPSGTVNGVSWSYVSGKLTLSSADSTMQIDTSNPNNVAVAKMLGFSQMSGPIIAADTVSTVTNITQMMVTVPQKLRTTIPSISVTPANILTGPLLAEKKPTIYLMGATLGSVQLTIDKTSGASNGVSWSVADGKLTLVSADPTMRVDTSTIQKTALANTLGFTGTEPAGASISGAQGSPVALDTLGFSGGNPELTTLSSPQDLVAALLAQGKPVLHVTTSSGDHVITINAPDGSSGGINWSSVNGVLTLSSKDPTMRIDVSSADNAATAHMLGFTSQLGPGSKIAAQVDTASAFLKAQPEQLTFDMSDGTNVATHTLSINGTSGPNPADPSGVSWQVKNGKLTLYSPSPIAIKGVTDSERAAAQSLGFNGVDLDLKVENTITSAGPLTRSILAGAKPSLQVRGNQVGTQVITIDGTNGTFNGITWSMTPDGKLQLSSADSTLQIDAGSPSTQAEANALGFTGAESQGSPLVASNGLVSSLLGSNGGMPISVTTDATGDKTVMINALNGTDALSGVSWSYNAQTDKLVLSSENSGFAVKVSSADTASEAQNLGFQGPGHDNAIAGARIRLTSTATDRSGALVDASGTVSRVGQSISFTGGIPENLIVAVTNTSDGMKRIAADVQTSSTASSTPPLPNLQVKILDSTNLEIYDPATGVSLANRTWRQDVPITYQGMSFTIHGNAKAGDIFTIMNDGNRTSDNRNALSMADLALTSIFGKGQGSFQDVYAGVTAKLGSSVETSNNSATAAAQAASDLKSAYDAKTGVNLDQEAADLIRYQQAYQAAAQVIMAARDMFSTILKSF